MVLNRTHEFEMLPCRLSMGIAYKILKFLMKTGESEKVPFFFLGDMVNPTEISSYGLCTDTVLFMKNMHLQLLGRFT